MLPGISTPALRHFRIQRCWLRHGSLASVHCWHLCCPPPKTYARSSMRAQWHGFPRRLASQGLAYWSNSAATNHMTSSTSASEPARQWRRWLAVFGGVFFGLGALLFALLLLIDPYDTGRFPSFGLVGVRDRSMRTADASRGRNPHFNAAVVGNSTAQIINPYRLSELTDLHFIQLSIPQTGPREQLELMHWVLLN